MEKKSMVPNSGFIAWLVWSMKFILFVVSSGYIFPHLLTASMDMKKYDEEARKLMM